MAQVRQLGPDDLDARLPAFADLLIACVEAGASIGFMAPLDRERAEAFWRGIMESVRRGERILLVAEDKQGGLLGTAQLVPARLENQPHRADVSKMMVSPNARRRGVGSALLQALEAEARAMGRWLLVLDTATGSPAEALYRKQGWERVGDLADYALWPDGRLCATTFYRRDLRSR
jgi:GNAT superfamily N-acetyltransferase